jgi:hypothetical protein
VFVVVAFGVGCGTGEAEGLGTAGVVVDGGAGGGGEGAGSFAGGWSGLIVGHFQAFVDWCCLILCAVCWLHFAETPHHHVRVFI